MDIAKAKDITERFVDKLREDLIEFNLSFHFKTSTEYRSSQILTKLRWDNEKFFQILITSDYVYINRTKYVISIENLIGELNKYVNI